MMAGQNIGKFSYLDYFGEKTLANGLQIKYGYSISLWEEALAIGHQFIKFANFSPANIVCYMVPKRLFNDFATLNMHCYITGQIIATFVISRKTIKFLNSTHQLMLSINCSLEEPQKIIYLKYNHNELLLNTVFYQLIAATQIAAMYVVQG